MMRLLNDILDLSKIEAGQLDVVEEPYDLHHALQACGKLLGPGAAQKRLALKIRVADDVPVMVSGDAFRVRQIVLNLLGNAIKFTEAGSVHLSATVVDGYIAITIRDTGIGISTERQASIFDEFVQADQTIARRYGGTGLGLAISNRLAGLMGGRILLESRPGEGTTVTLLLPAKAAHDASRPAGSIEAARLPSTRPSRVLLAEDHDVNQILVGSMLAHGGHEVVIVSDGAAAVAAVQDSEASGERFDVVLMDMQMPGMDGLTATRAIRAGERRGDARLPIIALTANAFAADVEAGREAGCDDHIAKPVSMQVLLATIGRWSRAPEPREESPVAEDRPRPRFTPSAAADAKYRTHRAMALGQVDMLVRSGAFEDAEVVTLAEALHKLAGTAGMFGERALGDAASELEEGLRSWSAEERAVHMAAAVDKLREAA
ncbi:MAG: response regulator [Sphingomonadales bacterium]|nr:MAG: response regulator [Sphingomonadales bacterium]